MSKDRSYGDDEVRAIVERALAEQPTSGVSHEDLLSIGAGVGLSSDAIERAAHEVREARLVDAARASVVARRRRGVAIHAFVFFAINAFLFAVNFLTTPGEWWFLFSVFGWGLGLLLHAGFGLFLGISAKRLERERRKQERLVAPSSGPRIADRRTGVRVEGPLDSIEPTIEPDAQVLKRRE
ncbi:MAG: 2TM domain-containing protein [Myxococcales bacterium]